MKCRVVNSYNTYRDLILSDNSRPLFFDSFAGPLAVQRSSLFHFCFCFRETLSWRVILLYSGKYSAFTLHI